MHSYSCNNLNSHTDCTGRYAVGLLTICPLGDLVRRRPLILLLTFTTATLTIGLAATSHFPVFQVLSFFVGVFSIVPQILTPLALDLTPPERRAFVLSILCADRELSAILNFVLSGIVGQDATWRAVYYIAVGLQYGLLVVLYFVLPDRPLKREHETYLGVLRGMARYAVTEPLLIQSCLFTAAETACLSNRITTLALLLGRPPFNFST